MKFERIVTKTKKLFLLDYNIADGHSFIHSLTHSLTHSFIVSLAVAMVSSSVT